jgi:hypothetical protein
MPEILFLDGCVNTEKEPDRKTESRKFLGIMFRCCNVYCRIYKNRYGTAYEGRCPRCGKQAYVEIGEGGTSSRFFEAE